MVTLYILDHITVVYDRIHCSKAVVGPFGGGDRVPDGGARYHYRDDGNTRYGTSAARQRGPT